MKRKLVLYINHMCNCACDFCYIKNMDCMVMDIKTIDKIASYVNSNKKKYDVIVFIGGEPFITPDIMVDFVTKIKDTSIIYSFMTNGLIDIQNFHNIFPDREYAFNISIKDFIDYKNSIMESNIRYIKSHGYMMSLETVLTPECLPKLIDMLSYMQSFGEDIKILRQHKMGDIWDTDDINQYARVLPKLMTMAIIYEFKTGRNFILPNKLQYLESERKTARLQGHNLVCQDSLTVCDIVGIDGIQYLCDGSYGEQKFKLGYIWDTPKNVYLKESKSCTGCKEYCYLAKNKIVDSFDDLVNSFRPRYRKIYREMRRLRENGKTEL